MRISTEKPPIFDEAANLFGVTPEDPIFYTYADTCYSPSGKLPPDDLIVHEQTHAEQQAHDPTVAKIWWQRYFLDPDFRIEQEAEACGEQYRFLCRRYKDRNAQVRILDGLAGHLSGEIYGNCITKSEAMKKIKAYATGTAIKDIEDHIDDKGDI